MTEPGQQYAPPPPPQQYAPPPQQQQYFAPPAAPDQYPPAPAQYAPPAPTAPAPYPPPAPAQYAPPQGYGQPTPYPYPTPNQGPTCRFCGAAPALNATARGHRGMVVIMQFRSSKGPFCRDCGIAVVRKMASDTMWQGWWGYFSFLATPVVLFIDFVLFLRLMGLAEPVRQPGSPPPLDKGRSVFLRPGILGMVVPLALLILFVNAIISATP
jgi:hypothetical protein